MSEVVGMILIFSAIIIGGTFMFGWEISLKEKIMGIALMEFLICILVFGCYLVAK